MTAVADEVARLADRLWVAGRQRTTIEPIGDEIAASGDDLVATAYEIQQHNVDRRVRDEGARVCGRKIGLTSVAVQRQLGVDQPDFGALWADRCHGDGETIPWDVLSLARVEAEVALVLGDDLDLGTHAVTDVVSAVSYAVPALEIVGTRIADWKISLGDSIADNASGDRFVVGLRPVALADLDLAAIEMSMTVDGSIVSSGRGADCMGNPLFAARWLADTMSARGTPLRAGDVVLTGALGPMHTLTPGASVHADLGALGSVSCEIGAAS
ncbi:MAG: fumarylacetoacetate hydrolase family protein [Actinomycetota bacterium]